MPTERYDTLSPEEQIGLLGMRVQVRGYDPSMGVQLQGSVTGYLNSVSWSHNRCAFEFVSAGGAEKAVTLEINPEYCYAEVTY